MNKYQKEVEKEIRIYNPPAKVQEIMRNLAKLGYECSGHGTGLRTGEQDFTMERSNKDLGSITVTIKGNKSSIEVSLFDQNIPLSSLSFMTCVYDGLLNPPEVTKKKKKKKLAHA